MKKPAQYLALFIIISFAFWISPLFNHPLFNESSEERTFKGMIEKAATTHNEEGSIQDLKIKITSPPESGKTITAKNETDRYVQQVEFKEGESVIVGEFFNADGTSYFVVKGHERYQGIYLLFLIFIIAVIIVAGWQGVGALLGLIMSFTILFKFILPQILAGASPIITIIIGAIFIVPINFMLSHRLNRKTIIAMIGTFITLIISGLLASLFAELTHLTGLASEEATFLKLDTQTTINFKGLVLGGILISILGILDDITVSQCSVIQQLKNAKESISKKELFQRGMKVGHDHISSLVNTLILVYAGASLPLLLLFFDSNSTFHAVLNTEFMAEEIVQTLIGSIGLVLGVPITTLLASVFITRKPEAEKNCPIILTN